MKLIYLTLIAIVLSILNTTHADTWAMPAEADYYSDNNLFAAHVTPSQNQTKAKLEIFRIADSQKLTMWACALGNEDAPEKVFITNDGNYAVTINEWGRERHGGWGDYVVAFYNKNGLIKNYSLEQILHYPEKISKDRFNELCPRSSSGRIWCTYPVFLDSSGNKLYFCIRLRHGKQWLAWDVRNGNEVEIIRELQTRWNEKGRNWAIKEGIRNPVFQRSAYEFLAEMKNPDDRNIFENLLKNSTYGMSGVTKIESKSVMRVYDIRCSSTNRKMADNFLSVISNKPLGDRDFNSQTYNYLGVIKGELLLPKLSEDTNSSLCLYLFHKDVSVENWRSTASLISLCYPFGRPEYPKAFTNLQSHAVATLPLRNMPFTLEGITPGEYRLKAVWCQTVYYHSCNCLTEPLTLSEYESSLSPVFEIKAGEKTSGINIECTHEITNESN